MASGSKKIRLKLGPSISSTITGNGDFWEILSRQHSILIEFAEGLCNLGKLDFSMVRILDGYYELNVENCNIVTISISSEKHPTIHGMYQALPYKERGIAMSCLLLMATKVYKESDNSAKLEVLRCSKVSEDIVIPGLNSFAPGVDDKPLRKTEEVAPSRSENDLSENLVQLDANHSHKKDSNESTVKDSVESISTLNPSIFEDLEDLDDFDDEPQSDINPDYTSPARY